MDHFSWITLLGGLAFFYFGLSHARHGLQLVAGDRLRLAITRLTTNRFKAMALGVLITVVLQSSAATILMLVSLAGTGLLTLPQAFGVILGADIGTTLVVVLLSIKKFADYALLLVVIGFVLEWLVKREKTAKYTGQILFGFGMVFYGMQLITKTASPLASNPEAKVLFEVLSNHPGALLPLAILFTLLVQTSAATIGMAIALSMAGVLTLPTVIPIVLGANVGTCFSAIFASVSGNTNGKRVAIAHLFVKVTGACLALPFIPQIARLVDVCSAQLIEWFPFIAPGVSGEIAIVHLGFNAALATIFLPLLPCGVWIVSKLVPEGVGKEVFGAKYLDSGALETPVLAFAQAKREILRVANLAFDLYQDCMKMFDARQDIVQMIQEIKERDDKIDLLEKEVRFYLAKMSHESLTTTQGVQQMSLLSIAADWEGVGDIISAELARLANKKLCDHQVFSEQGWQDILTLHQLGLENFSLTVSCFASPSEELMRKVSHHIEHFNEMEQQLRKSHIQRLHSGRPESFETSSIHLDVLGNLRRIGAHLLHIAQLSLQS